MNQFDFEIGIDIPTDNRDVELLDDPTTRYEYIRLHQRGKRFYQPEVKPKPNVWDWLDNWYANLKRIAGFGEI